MLEPRGTVLEHKGEEVVVICHDMDQTHYKVEAIDGRRFWILDPKRKNGSGLR